MTLILNALRNFKGKTIILLLAIILFGYLLLTAFFRLTPAQQCGGFAGEVGEFACPALFSCYYVNQYPDASGICRFIGDVLP